MVGRVEFLVATRVVIGRPAVLPLGEPELLGGIAHAEGVEDAVVIDQAFERAGPVAGDPVDHIAAVGRSQRAGLVAVEEGVAFPGKGPALLQVFQRAVAPVLADRIGEGLAVAGRTVEIDHHHRIARPGIGRGVPAPGPGIAERALRPAMDDEGDRILPALDIAGRLDDIAVHRLAVPAGEAELLGLAEGLGVQRRVHIGDPARHFPPAEGLDEQLARPGQGVLGEDETRLGLLEGRDMARAGDRHDRAAGHIDRKQPRLTDVAGRGIESPPVARPLQGVGGPVPVRSNLTDLSGRHVPQEDGVFVGLEPGPRHGPIRHRPAVRREHRTCVPCVIGVGQVLEGPVAAQAIGPEQVEIGAPRLGPAGHA